MQLTYRSLASSLLLVAVVISALFQLYRASLGTPYAVDRFGLPAAVAYAALAGLALALRTDRRWLWGLGGIVVLTNLVYGVLGYYPGVYAARPLTLLDWVEGTLYTGLLLAVLGCAVLRLSGATLSAAARPARAADRSPQPVEAPQV